MRPSTTTPDQVDFMSMPALLSAALAQHQTGNLVEASSLYQQLLAADPQNATAWHLFGRLAWDQQQPAAAIDRLHRAIALHPASAECYADLGCILEACQRYAEAEQALRRAVELKPGYVEALFNLANVLRQQDQFSAAAECYQRVLALRPDFAPAQLNLGVALEKQGRREDAIAAYQKAIELDPVSAQAHVNLATALRDSGQRAAAVRCLQQAIDLAPRVAENHNLLGAWHYRDGRRDEAQQCFATAVALNPNLADALTNQATIFRAAGELDCAAELYEQALRINPDSADVHTNRAWLWLITGDFARGWPEYEWRLKRMTPPPTLDRPYQGDAFTGQTVLVHHEQGLGDAIQFARYLLLLKKQAARVFFECPRSLHALFKELAIDGLLDTGARPPHFDVQIPLLSLPGIFQTTLATIPADIPYLQADPDLVATWRNRLADIPGCKIGIAWQGNPIYCEDRDRSISLEQFAPLAALPGVRLISLQKGFGVEQLAQPRSFTVRQLAGLDEQAGAFVDTAAVMHSLDLVVTSDTALAHLAGALGVPAWVALPFIPDWRWLLARQDSPWYPSLRLFRQPTPGDWNAVFQDMTEELQRGGGRSPQAN